MKKELIYRPKVELTFACRNYDPSKRNCGGSGRLYAKRKNGVKQVSITVCDSEHTLADVTISWSVLQKIADWVNNNKV